MEGRIEKVQGEGIDSGGVGQEGLEVHGKGLHREVGLDTMKIKMRMTKEKGGGGR